MITHPRVWLAIIVGTMLISLGIVLVVRPQLGIDFTGGTLLEIEAPSTDPTAVRQLVTQQFGLEATVQVTQDETLLIRTSPLSQEQHEDVVQALRDANLLSQELRFESIGPTIGAELRRKAWLAISAVVIMMIVYLAYNFRQTAGLISSWKFGVAAVVALLHDLLFVTAVFAILGRVAGAPIDSLFVTALLAILGYSINDTIVLFNRIKEEWLLTKTETLLSAIDRAARTTIVRSLNTSLTTLVVLSALLFFGGTTIRWFVVALAAGTIVGTYSSLFVAPPVLYFLARAKR